MKITLLTSAVFVASSVAFPEFSHSATVIAHTSFEEAGNVLGFYTDADLADHLLVNQIGQPVVAFTPTGMQTELSFSSFFSAARNMDGLSDGDFIGVKASSSNVATYIDGVLAYRLSDPDGTLTVTLGTVDLSSFSNVVLSAYYFLSDTAWESADFARIWVGVDGGTEIDLLNTIGSDIDDMMIENSWLQLTADLSGYTSATFHASFSSDSSAEEMWVDNITFSVPEPSRLGLLAVALVGIARRRRREW